MALANASAIRRHEAGMIEIEYRNAVAFLRLNRGGARNAISVQSWHDIASAVDEIASGTASVCVIVSDDDRAFSAGADIREFDEMRDDEAAACAFLDAMRRGIDAVADMTLPTIAAVDGGCFGAGVALAIAADIVIAGDGARFATTPAKLGLLYPQQDIDRLITRIGTGGASRMLLSGDALDADEAVRVGLADMRAAHARHDAQELANRIAANATGAVRGLKAQIKGWRPDEARQDFLNRFSSDEFAERLARFK